MNHVTICENVAEPSTWMEVDFDGNVATFLKDYYNEWPKTARIYHNEVVQSHDVTPTDKSSLNRLCKLSGHFYVIIYPEDFTLVLIIISIAIAVVSVALSFLLRPSANVKNQQQQSPNNELANRENRARPGERVPDIYGQVWATPDLIQQPYRIFDGTGTEIEYCYMCLGRGDFLIQEVRDDLTPISQITGSSVEVYSPFTSPNSGTPQLRIGAAIGEPVRSVKTLNAINGQVLIAPNLTGGGGWVGPFIIGDSFTTQLWLNFVAESGAYKIDAATGNQSAVSVTLQAGVTPCDTAGNATGAETTYNITITGSPSTKDRVGGTLKITLPAAGIYKVRARRTSNTTIAANTSVSDESQWRDCFAIAPVSNSYFADVTTVQTKTLPTPIALGLKARKLNMLVTRKVDNDKPINVTQLQVWTEAPPLGDSTLFVQTDTVFDIDTVGRNITIALNTRSDLNGVYYCVNIGGLTSDNTILNLKVGFHRPNYGPTAESGTVSGVATAMIATLSAAPIIVAMATDPQIGNRQLSELDLNGIYAAMDAITAYFGTSLCTEFCYTFDDSKVSFEEMLADVANAIFCTAYRRGSIISLYFEAINNNSRLLFNHRNKIPLSETRTLTFGTLNDNDGIELSYIDPNSPNFPSQDTQVTLYYPTDKSAKNPKKVEVIGVRNNVQAFILGWRYYQKLLYQNLSTQFEATQEASDLILKDRILVADNTRSDTQDGEIVSQAALILETSQKVIFDGGRTYSIFLQHADGSIESIGITKGADDYHVVLASAPSMALMTDVTKYARTTYQVVSDAPVRSNAFLVSEKNPKSLSTYDITAVNYDARYYSHDQDFNLGLVTDTTGGTTDIGVPIAPGAVYRPNLYSDTGSNPTTNPTNAFDNNAATAAVVQGLWVSQPDIHLPGYPGHPNSGNCFWNGFASIVFTADVFLYIKYTQTTFDTGISVFGTDGAVGGAPAGYVKYRIAAGRNISDVQVEAGAGADPTNTSNSISVFDIYIQ